MEGLDEFVRAYVECALWSSNDESTESGGEPLDRNYGADDVAAESLAEMRKDCESFISQGREDIESWVGGPDSTPYRRAGFLFWLNRNGHGSGFWDEDGYEQEARDRLSALSEKFGESYLYVGDDGKLYVE